MERGGESARELAEILTQPPEVQLDGAELQAVYDFEASLYDYEIVEGTTIADVFKDHKAEALVAPLVFADAFTDGKARDFEQEIKVALPNFETHQQVFQWFAERANDKTVETANLAKLSKYSIDYYMKHMTEALSNDTDINEQILDARPVVFDPEREIALANNTRKVREYLRDLRSIYKEGADPVEGAKRAIVDVYLGKVNSGIASDVSMMDYIVQQAELIGDNELARAAKATIPVGFQGSMDSGGAPSRLMRRLDYLANGMGIGQDEKASPLSAKLLTGEKRETESNSEPLFSEAEKEILQNTMISPDEMAEAYANILRKAGKLSSEDASTWTPTRRGRAHDNLFQVIKHPNKNTFTVDGVSGAYQSPSGERSLFDAMVVGGAHELLHINQILADDQLAAKLKIAQLKGRRVGILREGGANVKQREAEQEWFGASKPSGVLTYARAMQSLREGGTLMDAAKAFLTEKRANFPGANEAAAIKEAADRVLRLKRFSGHTSQPLSYAEEAILLQELEGAGASVQTRAGEVTSFDLVDQVRLHKYGLLPSASDSSIEWSGLVLEEFAPHIANALTAASRDDEA